MSTFFSRLSSTTSLLYIFVVLTNIASGIYFASGMEPPGFFAIAYPLGFLWIVGWWLRDDSRKRSFQWAYDLGLFLYVAWPVVLPYYLFKTRGIKALFLILAFAGVYVGAVIAGIVLYMVIAPNDWPRVI